jgi:hypothetical protein
MSQNHKNANVVNLNLFFGKPKFFPMNFEIQATKQRVSPADLDELNLVILVRL